MVQTAVNDIKVGHVIEYEKRLCSVLNTVHTKPGKGGAYVQMEIKDIVVGTKFNLRLSTSVNVERAILDETEYTYLYTSGDNIAVMDAETYEQEEFNKILLGDQHVYLQDGIVLVVVSYDEKALYIKVPDSVKLKVLETEASIKGQTVTTSYKPALLANGLRVMVPPFIKEGDELVIRTADSTYLKRVKN